MADQVDRETGDQQALGALRRWSRRKADGGVEEDVPSVHYPGAVQAGAAEPDDRTGTADDVRIDPRTGKPFSELTDSDMPDVETLDQDSDVSAFFAKGVSLTLRLAALRKLWHTPKFNQVDLMAEYSGDYTGYKALGDVVPHDLKRAVERQLERERQETLEARRREEGDLSAESEDHHPPVADEMETGVGQNDPALSAADAAPRATGVESSTCRTPKRDDDPKCREGANQGRERG